MKTTKSHQYSAYLMALKQDRESVIVEHIMRHFNDNVPLQDRAGISLLVQTLVSGEYEHLQYLSPLNQ